MLMFIYGYVNNFTDFVLQYFWLFLITIKKTTEKIEKRVKTVPTRYTVLLKRNAYRDHPSTSPI